MATSWLCGATDGQPPGPRYRRPPNPVRSDPGAGVRRSIRRAAAAKLELRAADALVGTQACSFAGGTVLTVVHESPGVPSFRGSTPPKTTRISCPHRSDSRLLLVIGS